MIGLSTSDILANQKVIDWLETKNINYFCHIAKTYSRIIFDLGGGEIEVEMVSKKFTIKDTEHKGLSWPELKEVLESYEKENDAE